MTHLTKYLSPPWIFRAPPARQCCSPSALSDITSFAPPFPVNGVPFRTFSIKSFPLGKNCVFSSENSFSFSPPPCPHSLLRSPIRSSFNRSSFFSSRHPDSSVPSQKYDNPCFFFSEKYDEGNFEGLQVGVSTLFLLRGKGSVPPNIGEGIFQ